MADYYTPQKGQTNNKWNKTHYERLNLFVPEGMNERIEAAAQAQGFPSKRAFCIAAIETAIQKTKPE